MAEALFNDLAEARGLPFVAESAGTAARGGHGIASYAGEALAGLGVRVGRHASRRIDSHMLDEADLVLAMGARHAARIEGIVGDSERIHLLARYAGEDSGEEVPDPYGLTLFAYRASARQLYGYVEKVLERMEEEYGWEAPPQ